MRCSTRWMRPTIVTRPWRYNISTDERPVGLKIHKRRDPGGGYSAGSVSAGAAAVEAASASGSRSVVKSMPGVFMTETLVVCARCDRRFPIHFFKNTRNATSVATLADGR